jgi:tRNA-2-methylthio-N6-dimethylallyladenosine synthase
MKKRGWKLAEKPEGADFIFLNTCSIREKAARRVIGHLNRLKALKQKNPALILGVGGCVAEQEGQKLLKQVPWLNLVVGPGRLGEIPQLLENLTSDMPPIVLSGQAPLMTEPAASEPQDHRALASFKDFEPGPSPISSFLTIMTGCDNYCAYCVVPYLRGRETSRPKEEILAEARSLVNRGSLELTLLGQNVNSYGRPGHRGGQDFVELLTEVANIPHLERLRFTTSHPKDFPPALVDLFGQLPNLCEHLHLPLQAGSDRILAAMGRRYDSAHYLWLVSALRAACPNLALSTDIIVGFPGETEQEFNQTVKMLESIGFDFIFSFKYSDRPMTKANLLPDKIEEKEKQRRLAHLQAVQKAITLEKHQALIGQSLEVLVDGFGRNQGQLSGRSRDLKLVHFDGPESLMGQLVMVKILEAWPVSLIGELNSNQKKALQNLN